ncbi:MAG: hypothetical protein RL018_1250 [Pseudomonadota bacterium]
MKFIYAINTFLAFLAMLAAIYSQNLGLAGAWFSAWLAWGSLAAKTFMEESA